MCKNCLGLVENAVPSWKALLFAVPSWKAQLLCCVAATVLLRVCEIMLKCSSSMKREGMFLQVSPGVSACLSGSMMDQPVC